MTSTNTKEETKTPLIDDSKDAPQQSSYGISDEEFEALMAKDLMADPVSAEYPEIFALAPRCITKWRQRYRGDPTVWKRLFHKDRVLKEFIEAAPTMDAVQKFVQHAPTPAEDDELGKFTIIDLASGKGFLSMFLSELLPPSKVKRFVLMDKAWPMHGVEPKPHHMSWQHIYGESKNATNDQGETDDNTTSFKKKYIDTWPIPLTTSKQDLKHGNQLRNLQDRFLKNQGPVIMLAIHLCGTLSLRAVTLFNENPSIKFFCLKPCCLPGMIHAKRHEIFQLGKHSFDSKLVCVRGKWNKDRWNGPNRSQLATVFDVWTENLYCGIAMDDKATKEEEDTKKEEKAPDSNSLLTTAEPSTIRKKHVQVQVQHDGGYQNDFLFAEREPVTEVVWDDLEKRPAKRPL